MRLRVVFILVLNFGIINSCTLFKSSKVDGEIDLTGTTWNISYETEDSGKRFYEILFEKGGRLVNHHPNESTPENDTWEQKGKQVVLKINDSYMIYTGRFTDRKTLEGEAENKEGSRWNWKAVLKD